jgi:hypothetical protein
LRYIHANVASFFFIFVYAQFYNIYFNLLFIHFLIYFYKSHFNILTENFLNIFKPSLSIKNNNINKGSKVKSNYDNDLLQWFSGFTDAEGSFKLNIKNNREVHFVFQITLHIEVVAVLFIIRDKLGIGIVSIKGSTCSFRVHSFQVIVENLLPIFDNNSALCIGTTLMWIKLSNSGKTLKLLIPNYIISNISS